MDDIRPSLSSGRAATLVAALGLLFFLAIPVATATARGPVTQFPIPTASSRPTAVAAGPDGNVWFVESSANKIGMITPTGTITEFAITTLASGPRDIAAGPDGNLWFTEANASQIGKITPTGTITEYPVPPVDPDFPDFWEQEPDRITAGPDGNMWFTVNSDIDARVERITPSGTVTAFIVPGDWPMIRDITAGPDGNVWYTEEGPPHKLGKVTPTGTITEYRIGGAAAYPGCITAGPDGNLWFATGIDTGDEGIARFDMTTGAITVHATSDNVYDITSGPDGNLWFTVWPGYVTMMTTSFVATKLTVGSTVLDPRGIVAGPDGNIWFTERSANKIACLVPPIQKITVAGRLSARQHGYYVGVRYHGSVSPNIAGTALDVRWQRYSLGSWRTVKRAHPIVSATSKFSTTVCLQSSLRRHWPGGLYRVGCTAPGYAGQSKWLRFRFYPW